MRRTLALAAAGLGLIASSQAALPSDIVGTWSTKSGKTLTGPVCLTTTSPLPSHALPR